MDIIADPTDTRESLAREVIEALEAIDVGTPHVVEFCPDEALYLEPVQSCSVPASDVAGKLKTTMVRCFDTHGREVTPDESYWAQHLGSVSARDRRSWRSTPNGGIRVGDVLAISAGEFFAYREYETAGERLVEFVTLDELQRRREAGKTAWIATHLTAVDAAAPAGFASWDVWDYQSDDDLGIIYEAEIGPVAVSWAATFSDERVKLSEAGPEVSVRVGSVSDMVTVDDMLELVDALMKAIPMVRKVQS